MINLVFLNNALGKVTPGEFTVLYYIANNLSLKNTTRTRIFRDQIADKLDISPRQVSRLTDALVAKGFLKKDVIVNTSVKSVCYYSLVTTDNEDGDDQETNSKVNKDVQETSSSLDKNVPLKKNINNKEKNINNKKSYKQVSGKRNDFKDYVHSIESECEREAGKSL